MDSIFNENSSQREIFDAMITVVKQLEELEAFQQFIEWQIQNAEAKKIALQKSLVINKKNIGNSNGGCAHIKWHNPKPAVYFTLK